MSQLVFRFISHEVVSGPLALKMDTDWWRKDLSWLVFIIISASLVANFVLWALQARVFCLSFIKIDIYSTQWNAEQARFYFSTASLPLKRELQTSQDFPPLTPTLCCFYSPRFILFSSRPTILFIAHFLTLALLSLFHLRLVFLTLSFTVSPLKKLPSGVRQIPDIPGSWLMTTKESRRLVLGWVGQMWFKACNWYF